MAQSSSKAMVGSMAVPPPKRALTPKAFWYKLEDWGALMN
jgi:hypothetical protein